MIEVSSQGDGFFVLDNGTEKRPEYEEMRLSQSFYHQMRGKDLLSIADEVEESVEVIQPIDEDILVAPSAGAEQIYDKVYSKLG